jgi:protein tyrosine phosphatase (PTP) superfamily phosphohydrolase (DUF442 family)
VADWTPDLSWIQPDLAVGAAFPCEQAASLATDHGVGAVIDLRSEACDDEQALRTQGVWFLHLPTPDMMGVSQAQLDTGVAFARRAARSGRRLLIHCQHGIGRSALLALCVLTDRGLEPMTALTLAKDARLKVSPSEAQHAAWVAWLSRRQPHIEPPSYHQFGCVAYRHLAQNA